MTFSPLETRLIEARRLRPLKQRVRDSVVAGAVDTTEDAIDLALESPTVLGLTLAGVIGWLFRKRLGAIGHAGWTWVAGRFAHRIRPGIKEPSS